MTRLTQRLFSSSAVLATALIGASALPTMASAQIAPSGYIYDAGAVSGFGTQLSSYTLYSTTFTATSADTTVAWAFREDPGYFLFDDASVSLTGGGPNLLVDPGFENATAGTSTPSGWIEFSEAGSGGPTGIVQTAAVTGYGTQPHLGSNYWFDGSIGGYDGLAQTLHTTVGKSYTVSFYLGASAGNPEYNYNQYFSSPSLDAFVYAGKGLPDGVVALTTGVPEPATWAAMLLGFGGIGASMRSRRAQQRLAA